MRTRKPGANPLDGHVMGIAGRRWDGMLLKSVTCNGFAAAPAKTVERRQNTPPELLFQGLFWTNKGPILNGTWARALLFEDTMVILWHLGQFGVIPLGRYQSPSAKIERLQAGTHPKTHALRKNLCPDLTTLEQTMHASTFAGPPVELDHGCRCLFAVARGRHRAGRQGKSAPQVVFQKPRLVRVSCRGFPDSPPKKHRENPPSFWGGGYLQS